MKRKLALLISVFMLVTALLPVSVFAAGDMGLGNAINTAKALFGITEDYTEFNYSANAYNGKTVWYLHWSKANEDGGISVQIDEKGTVLSYDMYKYYDYSQRKLPRVTKDEALKTAEEFINKVDPELLKQLKLDDTGKTYITDPYYYFNYYRVHNNIVFPDNRVTISVNKQTGEVQNYNYNWTEAVEFPSDESKISLEAAQKVYKEKLGLKLVYRSYYDQKEMKVYLAYVPVLNSNVCIDALTGEKVELYPSYYATSEDQAVAEKMNTMRAAGDMPQSLSPEELKAVTDVQKLLTLEQAEAKARAIKQLELTAEYKLGRYGISRNWMYQREFTWNLNFEKASDTEKGERYYVNVTLDGVTGEIEGFYRNYEPTDKTEAKYDKEGAKKAVDEFLKELLPAKFESLQYEERQDYRPLAEGEEAPRYYDFGYTRLVDGVPYVNNTASVGIDAVTGKVNSFNLTWFDIEFPSKDKVLTIEKAYESLFGKIGLELQYKLKQSREIYYKYGLDESQSPEVVLVYRLDEKKPAALDANTGAVINYDGSVYKEDKPIAYTDIDKHFAKKEIEALAGFGIGFEGTEFRPDDGILQKDFLSLISKVINYYGPSITDSSTGDEIDKMYVYLMREGIVKATEKSPTSSVTREEGMKFIIRALKYDKVAELPGIFTCKFADAAEIDPALYGYVTIGSALKLINGDSKNNFNPKLQLARGEAALIIYRMLQIG